MDDIRCDDVKFILNRISFGIPNGRVVESNNGFTGALLDRIGGDGMPERAYRFVSYKLRFYINRIYRFDYLMNVFKTILPPLKNLIGFFYFYECQKMIKIIIIKF